MFITPKGNPFPISNRVNFIIFQGLYQLFHFPVDLGKHQGRKSFTHLTVIKAEIEIKGYF